ncbi:MAG: heme ABC exporter ATP-binding protein CcmA [Vicinamibacteria bacterium]
MTLAFAPPAFAARRLTKRFGRQAVLKEIDLDLEPGRCHVIFGRNGAGKSTLLLVAATLVRPSSGEIFYDGARYEEIGDAVRSRIGLLSHQSFLYPDLSVFENLQFYGRLYGIPASAPNAEEALVWADLELRRHSPTRSLSRGMQQRLALARAFLHRPRLLLLDEPYTGLDEPSSERLSARLQELKSEAATLLTTHDVERGVALADRILIMESGRIAFDATGASAAEVRRLLLHIPGIAR